jgi:hypothetical protein
MTTFKPTRRELSLEFAVKTSAKIESFNGTKFIPNRCAAGVLDGEVYSLTLERVGGDGWIEDDPAVDSAVLSVSYGGGELMGSYRPNLPKVAQDALIEIEKHTD